MLLSRVCLTAVLACGILAAQPPPKWDNYSDTWVATDALGRKVQKGQRPPQTDRMVAMFYFLWLGPHAQGGPWDITRILKIDPDAMSKKDSPLWGPMHAPHHWGESMFGYYLSDDEWVLRKHAAMLTDAGVDTLIFDTSNKVTYRSQYTALLEAFRKERAAGNRTPQVAFLTPFWDPKSTVRQLYDELYSKALFKEFWFQWDGKPLILADPAKVDAELRPFFTFRDPQPSYFVGPTGPDMWSWLEIYPQHVFRNSRGEKEEMSVGVAQNAADGKLAVLSAPRVHGRSFHAGRWEAAPDAVMHGYNFAEQWERASAEDPRVIFITNWNEWIAGRFDEFNGVRAPVMFVDEFNQENSRDVEPMKGGHGDSYYYQMVNGIRRYKGARLQPAAGPPITVDLLGSFSVWNDIAPEYRDACNDTFPRNHAGYNTATRYVDNSRRNDLVAMKVARDANYLYFYARTREPITSHTDPNWMMLFLDTDRNHDTGWEGYDYLVNHRVKNENTSVLEHTRTGWGWEPAHEVKFQVKGNELMMAVPRKALGLTGDKVEFEFKWADNIQREASVDEFTLSGDAAPPGRFNYLYWAGK